MTDRDQRAADTAGGGGTDDVDASVTAGLGAGGLGVVGRPGVGAGALGGALTADAGADEPDDGTKGGRIGDDQDASAGAVGAAVGNQAGAVDPE